MKQLVDHIGSGDVRPHLDQSEEMGMAPSPGTEQRLLTGWGRTSPSASEIVTPHDLDELAQFLAPRTAPRQSVIARGLGRSYGDAAQCSGGVVVDTSAYTSIGPIDPESGLVEVGGGTSLAAIMRVSLALGWFIPVSPGTRHVTVGGAIAADVHGKNHHRDGGFCSFVASVTLVTPAGIFEISPDKDADLFWATAGGMGLTGVVVKATLCLIKVETSSMEVDTERCDDLDSVMSAMEAADHNYRYSVAWVDCSSRGKHLGRSVLTRGDHAPIDAVGPPNATSVIDIPSESPVRVPFNLPRGVVGPHTTRAFNELWFRKAPKRRCGEIVPLTSFFYPLDGINEWNRLYGRRGFVQYQFAVGSQHGDVVRAAVGMMGPAGMPSSLAVLKRFGPGDPGPLSFPIEGWTLALDFPAGLPGLPPLLDRFDDLVAGVGGRIYLAKDSRLRPELLRTMYPRIGEWEAVRDRVDPDHVLQSDLSRRLGLGRKIKS